MTPYLDPRYKCPYGCGSTMEVQEELYWTVRVYCPHHRKTFDLPKLTPLPKQETQMRLPSDLANAILHQIQQQQEYQRMAEIDYVKKGVEVANFVKGVFVVQENIDDEGAMEIATWFAQFNQVPTQGMTKFTIGFIRGLRTKKNELLLAEKSQVVESD